MSGLFCKETWTPLVLAQAVALVTVCVLIIIAGARREIPYSDLRLAGGALGAYLFGHSVYRSVRPIAPTSPEVKP